MDIDRGHNNFKYIIDQYHKLQLANANEAETREKVIDEILDKILGWDTTADISYEERVTEDGETTFCDYLIKTATTSIIVEAKKVGKAFEIANNMKTGLLGGVLSEGEVGVAIRQARDYARKLSIPYAVVTNGSTWIIFPAVRIDGVSFEKTEAVIFRDLNDIQSRFVKFWELLSRQRVIEGNLESVLFGKPKDTNIKRLIHIVKEPGYRLGRNRLYEYIESAVALALSDESILDDIEGLDFCYVKNSERIKYDSRLKMYLADIKPQLERKVVRTRSRTKIKYLDANLEKSITLRPQFLLVLGPVGAGKTTFLNYTSKVSVPGVINDKILWVYIDFKKATDSDNIRSFLYKELLGFIENEKNLKLNSWEDTIQNAYNEDIEHLKYGPLSLVFKDDKKEFNKEITKIIMNDRDNLEPFVEKILKYASKIRPIFVVVDNIDQIESEDFQQKVFNESQAIARRINSNFILSLRESTYLKHRNKPVFDAFQVDTIYIDPPGILPVLSRRFAYAKKVLENKSADIISETGIRFNVPDLSVFFGIVASSLLSQETGYLIESLAGGDIRRGLTLVREFLSSGHTSADKALQTFITNGVFKFPKHEIFKGALLGQRKHYREEESLLLNIYDSKLMNKSLQLLRLNILNCLVDKASDISFEGLEVEEIKSDLYRVGVTYKNTEEVLSLLSKFGAIKTIDGTILSEESKIIPTRFGGYLLKILCHEFMYLEPCLIDSSIFDMDIWEELSKLTEIIESVSGLKRVEARIKRVEIYLDYLKSIEEKWVVDCKRFNISSSWDYQIIEKDILPKAKIQFKWVLRSAGNQLDSLTI